MKDLGVGKTQIQGIEKDKDGRHLERPPLLKNHLRLVPEGGISKGVLLYIYRMRFLDHFVVI